MIRNVFCKMDAAGRFLQFLEWFWIHNGKINRIESDDIEES